MNYVCIILASLLLAPLTVKPARIECPFCPNTYSNNGNCRAHINSKHVTNPTKFFCQTCHKPFVRRSGVTEHIKRVHNKIPYDWKFPCSKCKQLFSKKFNAKRHEGGCKKTCKICRKRFAKESNAKRHARGCKEQPPTNPPTQLPIVEAVAALRSCQSPTVPPSAPEKNGPLNAANNCTKFAALPPPPSAPEWLPVTTIPFQDTGFIKQED